MSKKVKGFKAFHKDFTCNNFKFKVGKTFKHEGKIALCKEGFHFCKEIQHIFNYYDFSTDLHVCEIEASGEVEHGDDKSVCSTIKIIRELPWDEVLKLSNLGTGNLGHGNAGNRNAGYYNAGYGNAGNRNAGYYNAGNHNAGYGNAGNHNAGYGNAGNGNAGYYNAGYGNAGLFNSKQGKMKLFNKETNIEWNDPRIQLVIQHCPDFQEYVYFSSMTAEEKKAYPYAETTGGYYRQLGYKEGWVRFWGNSTEQVRKAFLDLPNFNATVFEEITGIKVKG